MYCPKCSQERKSTETVYCTRCGFNLTEVAKLTDETTPAHSDKADSVLSQRKRGLRQAFFIFSSVFILFTTGLLLQTIFWANARWLVFTSVILFFVGVFFCLYALAFESNKAPAAIQPRPTIELPDRDYVVPAFESPSQVGELASPAVSDRTTKYFRKGINRLPSFQRRGDAAASGGFGFR